MSQTTRPPRVGLPDERWTDEQWAEHFRARNACDAVRLARRIGRALRDADRLMQQFLDRHGDGCPCPLCTRDGFGVQPGAVLAEMFAGSHLVFSVLINNIDGEVGIPCDDPDAEEDDADQDGADEPAVLTIAR